MPKSISSLGQSPVDIEQELFDSFPRLVYKAYENGDITQSIRDHLISIEIRNLDDMEDCYNSLVEAIEKKDYYKLISRIEKADEVIATEQDPAKKEYYRKKQKELIGELERMTAA